MTVQNGFEGRVGDSAARRALLDVKRRGVFSTDIRAIVTLTAAEYAALSPPDPETLYVVI